MWAQRCDDLGAVLTLDAFVFSNHPDGSQPYAPRAINQRYRKLALKLKLRSTRLHSLRHYSATELVAAGVDIRTVAGRLGHGSGGATTLQVYAAWVDEVDHRAARTMAAIVPKPAPAAPRPRGPAAPTRPLHRHCASRSGPASSSPATSCPPSPNSPSRTRWRSGQLTERSPSSRTRA